MVRRPPPLGCARVLTLVGFAVLSLPGWLLVCSLGDAPPPPFALLYRVLCLYLVLVGLGALYAHFAWQNLLPALGLLLLFDLGFFPLAMTAMAHRLHPGLHTNADDCRKNMSIIAQALETYAQEHQGAYPEQLGQLTPIYLSDLPTCPSAGLATYRAAFAGDRYTLVCKGRNHLDEKDWPHWTWEDTRRAPSLP